MSIDQELGGPSPEDRQLVYARMGLSNAQGRFIDGLIRGSGNRIVASAALTNIRVQFNSLRNGAWRVLESHTCELVYAYLLELDPDVIGYYVQICCPRIERTTQHGRRHVSTAHIDFLVFRQNTIELVECKREGWLREHASTSGSQWVKTQDQWTYAPCADWAAPQGLTFRVWAPSEPLGSLATRASGVRRRPRLLSFSRWNRTAIDSWMADCGRTIRSWSD